MTTFSNNLRIPHLDQNVAQPEIPENTAKNIMDAVFTNVNTIVVADASADIVITHVDDPTQPSAWQSYIFDVVESGVALINPITVFLPDNPRPYIFRNNSSQTITFSTTTGTGFILSSGSNVYAFSDGVNMTKLEFAASGAGSSFISLNDTPAVGTGVANYTLRMDAVGNVVFTDQIGTMIWKGVWVDGTYNYGQVVQDDGWLMLANTTTTDRAAPQTVGYIEDSIDKSLSFISNSQIAVVKMVHSFTMSKTGYLYNLYCGLPSWSLDYVTRITILNTTTGNSHIINNPVLSIYDEWVNILNQPTIVTAGDVLEVWFEAYNSTAGTDVTGKWNSSLGTGVPISSEFSIDNLNTPTILEVSYTDINTVDRSVELDGIAVNSVLEVYESSSIDRQFEAVVTAIDTTSNTSTKYSISLIDNGPKDIRDGKACTVTFTVPVTKAAEYSSITDHFIANQPSWATISSKLYYDGVIQVDTDDAYRINIDFQELSKSPDWDILATSETIISSNTELNGITLNNYGEKLNEIIATSGAVTIDLVLGNVVTMTVTAATTITFSTTHANTSFSLLITDGDVNVTWGTVIKWEGGNVPVLSTVGDDLLLFTKIGSIWIGTALIGVA